MRNWIAAVAVALFAVGAAPAAKAGPYTAEYVFGDSLTDSGNLVLLAQANPALFPGFSHPSPPYAGGRYSNGPVWVELLASSLGLPLTPSLQGGTNYSFAGALTGSGSIPSVRTQAAQYLTAVGGTADPRALYVVTGGGNDIRGVAPASPTIAPPPANPAVAQAAADNLAAVLAALYAAGARNFLVATPPDVSLLPEVQGSGSALATNRDVRASLSSLLRNDLRADVGAFLASSPGASVAELDVYGLIRDAVANPSRYGFTNTTDPCFFAASPTACATYVFSDTVHPTAAGHVILAQAALAAIPEPGTLGLLAAGLLVLVVCVRRPVERRLA